MYKISYAISHKIRLQVFFLLETVNKNILAISLNEFLALFL